MKKLTLLFSVLLSSFCFSQSFTKSNFNSDLMNLSMRKKFNEFRKSKNLDTLIFSQSLYDTISYINCMEVAKAGTFYHPDVTKRWKKIGVKNLIAKESKSLFNDSVITPADGIPLIEYWENAFRFQPNKEYDYDFMAELAIESWELSPGHKKTQNSSFTSEGLPGFFSCHSTFADNGYVYIYINFVRVLRD